jgi:hypothetical protein
MKREIMFEIPDTTEYRVLCRYGYDEIINFAWWGYVQKKYYYKKFIFFGEQKWKWVEIDRCWWSKSFENIEELKDASFKLYDQKVLLIPRLNKKAMEL